MTSAGNRKSPQEKKRFSLAKDRRNTYGENDKASRKLIPRRKQEGQMQLRHAIAQDLRVTGPVDQAIGDVVEVNVANTHQKRKRKLIKKSPDTPLGEVLRRRKQPKYYRT